MYYDFFHKTQCFPVFRTDYNSHYISYTSLTYFIDKFYHVLFLSVDDHTVSASLLCEVQFLIRLPVNVRNIHTVCKLFHTTAECKCPVLFLFSKQSVVCAHFRQHMADLILRHIRQDQHKLFSTKPHCDSICYQIPFQYPRKFNEYFITKSMSIFIIDLLKEIQIDQCRINVFFPFLCQSLKIAVQLSPVI